MVPCLWPCLWPCRVWVMGVFWADLGGRGWASAGIALVPPSLPRGIGLTCSCSADALLQPGRLSCFSLCSRLLSGSASFIVSFPFQNVGFFHALKKDFDLELVHALNRGIVRCSGCCNINAVVFFPRQPTFPSASNQVDRKRLFTQIFYWSTSTDAAFKD